MQFAAGCEEYARRLKKSPAAVTIGNFDGMHTGHRRTLERLAELAGERKLAGVVLTFEPHPAEVLSGPAQAPFLLTTLEEKRAAFEELPFELFVVTEKFDANFAGLEAETFLTEILVGRLGAEALVAGPGMGFGKGRRGNFDWLRSADRPVRLHLETPELLEIDGAVVSSTRIRDIISSGGVREVARLLGRHYEATGEVVEGDQRGRTLGFPTANLRIDERKLLPADGVYAVRADSGTERWEGVANLGSRPTFGNGKRFFEAHLLDFDGDLYGRRLNVRFIERIRPERNFAGGEELAGQIRRDIESAKKIFMEKGGEASYAS